MVRFLHRQLLVTAWRFAAARARLIACGLAAFFCALPALAAGPLPGAAARTAPVGAAASRASSTTAVTAPLILRGLHLRGGAASSAEIEETRRATAANPAVRADAESIADSNGYSPAQIRAAYSLPATGTSGQTIAVLSAYDDPSALADLAAYSAHFHLPPCTVANGCLREINEQGQPSPLPVPDPTGGTFSTESSTGIELAHGLCESCSILLVEASSPLKYDFGTAAASAASAGATVLVTTFATGEADDDSQYEGDFATSGMVTVTAAGDASGTYGYSGAPEFPAALPGVLAVGGTTLQLTASGHYRSEQAWAGTVSGCSLFEPAPAWQLFAAKAAGCGAQRAVADIAADANPGAFVYLSQAGIPGGPWYQATGTSVSAPIIASVIGLAGSLGSGEIAHLYTRAGGAPMAVHDVSTGVDASPCKSLICRAGPGWDGPTGLGTPYGLTDFLRPGSGLDRAAPKLSMSAAGGRLSVSRRWATQLTVANQNAFEVDGPVTVRAALRIGHRVVNVSLTTRKVSAAPLASTTVPLTIASGERSRLRLLHTITVSVQFSARAPTGPSVEVVKKLRLAVPGP